MFMQFLPGLMARVKAAVITVIANMLRCAEE
jgi:hypothetical protein